MSAIPVAEGPCGLCGVVNPSAHAYCGGCGGTLATASPVASRRLGYRGPQRVLLVSGSLFVLSALIAAGSFLAMQTSGAPGIAMDFISGNTGGASGLLVAAFVLGFVVAGANLVVLVCANLWLLSRWMRDRNASTDGPVIAHAAAASRRQATAALARGSARYAEAKPRVGEAAKKGRRAIADDMKPRVAATAEKAIAKGRQYAEAKPRLGEVAERGRMAFDGDVKPRVAASADKAVAKGRQLIGQRRHRPPNAG